AGTGGGAAGGLLPPGTSRETVTVADAAGCRATIQRAPMVIDAPLSLSLQPPVVNACTGAVSLLAQASGGDGNFTYAFTLLSGTGATGSGTLSPGTHVETVTVTDGMGCRTTVQSAPMVVDAPLLLDVLAPAVNACTGEVTMIAQASGGDGNYTYNFRFLNGAGGIGTATLLPGLYH